MNKFWSYISVFLSGALVICLIVIRYILKTSKQPIVNIDTLIEEVNQSIKKLKQDGTGNVIDVTPSINIEDKEIKTKPKKLFGIFKRKIKQ